MAFTAVLGALGALGSLFGGNDTSQSDQQFSATIMQGQQAVQEGAKRDNRIWITIAVIVVVVLVLVFAFKK